VFLFTAQNLDEDEDEEEIEIKTCAEKYTHTKSCDDNFSHFRERKFLEFLSHSAHLRM
jgi:hypothetical protein